MPQGVVHRKYFELQIEENLVVVLLCLLASSHALVSWVSPVPVV